MLPLNIEITDQNGIQWRPPYRNLKFAKSFYGGEDVWCAFILDRDASQDYPDVGYGFDVVLRNGLAPRFAGEIRQIESDLETVTVKVLGSFVYLDDYGYEDTGKLWCESRYGKWRRITLDEIPGQGFVTHMWEMDNQNRLYVAPRKGEFFGNTPWTRGGWYYKCQYDSIKRVSFTYWWAPEANWAAFLKSYAADWTGGVTLWTSTTPGIGTKDVTISPEQPNLTFHIERNAAPNAEYTDVTGALYLRIIDLRLWGEDGPLSRATESPSIIHIAEDIIGQLGTPTTPISVDDELVQESLFVRDTFTDANNMRLDVGITPHHNPDIDKERGEWTENQGQWDIQGQVANIAANDANDLIATIDAGVSDCIVTADVEVRGDGNVISGLTFRFQDLSNYWRAYIAPVPGYWALGYMQGGGWNPVTTINMGIEWTYNYNLMVKLRGDRIDCYLGGVWLFGVNNDAMETATRHGLYGYGARSVGARFDNFEVFQALPLWPLFYEKGQSCHKALVDASSYGDWDFRDLGWGIEPGGSRLYLRRADRSRVRYVIPPHHASRLSARGQTDKGFVTEAWGQFIDEDGVERFTPKYYAHVTPTGIVANISGTGDDLASTIYGVIRERVINFGREDAFLAEEYLRQYLEEHAHPQVKSSFEIFGPVQDRFKGGAWIEPYEMEMGYVVQIPYFRAVEAVGVTGTDIRWDVGGGSDTTFLLVAMQYDAENGRAKLIPEGASEDLERLMKYTRDVERGQEKSLMDKRWEGSFNR